MKWIFTTAVALVLSMSLAAQAQNTGAEAVQKELLPVVQSLLPELAYGSSYEAMDALTQAMINEESPERIARLAMELKKGSHTNAQFLISVLEKIEGDPQKLQRFERALSQAQEQVKSTPLPKTAIGSRIVPFTSIGMGLVGLTYGYWSGYLGSAANNILIEHSTFISVSLAGMFISAGINEVRSALASIKHLKLHVRKYLNGKRVLQDLTVQLAEFKKTGLGDFTRSHMQVLNSQSVKAEFAKNLAARTSELSEKYAEVSRWSLPVHVHRFFESRELKAEQRKFVESLSEAEKLWFKEDILKNSSSAKSVAISAKLRFFEFRTQVLFEKWLKDGGEIKNLRAMILETRSQFSQGRLNMYKPQLSARITMWSLSTGIGLMGLAYSLGPNNTVLDPIFSQTAVNWLRGQTELFRWTSAAMIIGSLGYQVFDTMLIARKKMRQVSRYASYSEEFSSMLKILDQVDAQKIRGKKSMPALSAEELIEKLLRTPEATGSNSCVGIFA